MRARRRNRHRHSPIRVEWLIALLSLVVLLAPMRALAAPDAAEEDFGGGPLPVPQDMTTAAERAEIEAAMAATAARLEAEGRVTAFSTEAVSFEWPLQAANGLDDYGYHGVSGFVDHDSRYGYLEDYTCRDRTYDLSGYNHAGTDFFTYPYPWFKVDQSHVEVIAAAPGTLYYKRDGQYDRQCAMTGALSNAVVIQHADGSKAYYYHMKQGSVTSKATGDAIAVGEVLGVVASSGSSTGPHLHFEVRDATGKVVDPFHGDCNASPSMWASQPPYYDSAVIAVNTHSARPEFRSCPQTETPNFADVFAPDDAVYLVTTYRDQLEGQTSTYRLLRPNGSVYDTWSHASTAEHYRASYWWWSKQLDQSGPPPSGTWTFEVDFEGTTYETQFRVGVGLSTTITVTHPNGGEGWPVPMLVPIVWDDVLDGDVAIDLYAGGVFHSNIVTSTPSDGVFFWGTGDALPTRTDYTVRVMDAADPDNYDESDAPFALAPVPAASFTRTPSTGVVPLTVAFSDTSTSLVDAWLWGFGDGVTSTVQHPTHTYTRTGSHTVTLAVSGPTGSDAITRTSAVTVTPPPLTADFLGSPTLGIPLLPVTFADHSTGPAVDRWRWDFGDGITSTEQHPSHIYSLLGDYAVTLTVGSGAEEDTVVKPAYVHVVDEIWATYLPLVLK